MYLVCNRKIDDTLFSSRLVDDLACGFNLIAPWSVALNMEKITAK